ncbi:surfactin synthase thioesterase subunit [Streptomyces candidus]|uniref:Surfactin synthase thioesterase subunit n=1 Tax=Streptomyces candidus TaxID=67283 RepID=A0A7X0LP03_9ACTN|nr:surfactin synthase thioesterase subunit [Streptomyces candidus]
MQLPGRGRRSSEPSFTDSRHLATSLAHVLDQENDSRPYALFGHSLGALAAFETSRRLRRARSAPPVLLALSALPAPHTARFRAIIPHCLITGDLVLTDLIGPLPQELCDHPESAAAFGVPLLADLTLLLQHRHHEEPPVESAVALYGGCHDPVATPDDLATWNDLFTNAADPTLFPGNHTYPIDQPKPLTERLVRDIQAAYGKPLVPAKPSCP